MKRIKDYMIEKIEASKPQLIEAFTHVYGQSHYDFIKERINTTKVCICHDSVDIVDLLRMEHHVKKNGFEDKEKLLESIDFMIKCRRMYDKYDDYVLKELKVMFPALKRKKLPMVFINAFNSFDKKFGKDEKENKRIRESRITYFKELGLDLGNNYDDYINNEQAKKLIPSKALKSDFKKLYSKLLGMHDKLEEYFSNNSKEIESILELYKYDSRKVKHSDLSGNKVSYCMPNTIHGEVYPLCVFHIMNLIDPCEMVYIHEFSHALGISAKSKSNLYCKGKFKYINEALEEASIKEVYEYMQNHNYHIIHQKPGRDNDSIYNVITPIGEAFLKKFKDKMEIIRFGNEEDLYKVIDEETLDKLDGICQTILEERRNEDFVKMLQDVAIKQIKEYTPNNKR